MRVLSLFSGIGGFDLACEWAGMEIAGQVEIDPFCLKVLAKHWPDVPRMGDIHDVRGDEFGPIDLVVGGFPCQPYSVAGKRAGQDDDRALWPEMRRVIDEARPHWIVAENVPGFISLGLDDLLADLETLGYETRALVVPAAGVGAPHIRQRLWVLAYAERAQRRQGAGTGDITNRHDTGRQEAASGAGECGQNVADTNGADGQTWSGDGLGDRASTRTFTCSGRDDAEAASRGPRCRTASWPDRQPAQLREGVSDAGGVGYGAPDGKIPAGRDGAVNGGGRQVVGALGERLDGIPAGLVRPWAGDWESGLSRTTDGERDRVAKLKALGNSIVPQVAYEIIRAIAEIDTQ